MFKAALGVSASDAEMLRRALLRAATTEETEIGPGDGHGTRYTFDLQVSFGTKSAVVRRHWIVRRGEAIPRLATCYVV